MTPDIEPQSGGRVVISIPTHEMVPAVFMYDLARLFGYTTACLGPHDSLGMNMVLGTYVHSARMDLAVAALQQDATHILWVDSDMRFPKEALLRLLEHQKPVVGINYSTRTIPPTYVAIKRVARGPEDLGGYLATTEESTGLEQVEAIGLGLCLMDIEVLVSLGDPVKRPWFGHEWREDIKQWVGEDVFFSQRIREAGYEIFVDHDLSKKCAHLGSLAYRLAHVEEIESGDN